MHAIRGLLEKKALVREAEGLRELLRSWSAVVSKRKLEEVTAREVEEMNARLAEVQGTQKETTKRVCGPGNGPKSTVSPDVSKIFDLFRRLLAGFGQAAGLRRAVL